MLDITSLGNQIETDKSNITLKQTKSHDAFFISRRREDETPHEHTYTNLNYYIAYKDLFPCRRWIDHFL